MLVRITDLCNYCTIRGLQQLRSTTLRSGRDDNSVVVFAFTARAHKIVIPTGA